MSETTLKAKSNSFVVRFSLVRRIEHWILFLSFTTLAVTGLIQKFSQVGISDALIVVLGGIELTRIIHRTAATIFLLETIYHLVIMGYQMFVLRLRATMLPGIQDLKEGLQAFGYNLGLAKRRPKAGRYSFDEKLEYWAMIWGLVLMALTGFMLWNPILSARVLPGVFIPAAKAVHGAEAILAVLAILVWHLYHVHLRHWNWSMITGKLTRHEMEADHALELEHIETEEAPVGVPPAVLKKRRQVYFPVAAVLSVAMLFGIYRLMTAEQTAITTTMPPGETVQVFEKQTPTAIPPTPTAAPTPTSAPTPTGQPAQPTTAPNANALTWDSGIGQIFASKCVTCHGTLGGLSLADYVAAMKGGSQGTVIKPGDSAGSTLVTLQAAGGHPGQLTADELVQVKAWIDAGALEK